MKKNREGEQVPDVTFPMRQDSEWVDVTTNEIFKGKNVIVFSLPGAFTPTCSSSHVPRYNHLYDAFKKEGIDEIICMSVNDTFVMNEWSKDQHAEKIRFIADGNGEFSKGMDMLVDKSDLGFGMRSWRYSMLVNDGKIIKQFIEPDVEGDPFEVSDADTMFKYVAPTVTLPSDIVMFSKDGCAFCADAKELLDKNGMRYEELVLGNDYTDSALRAVSGKTSTPQIFINGTHIGGSEELNEHLG